jgi:N-acetylglucosaminyldiphosphoundecaprenol N-acetyl-beta-D-mannosaminyltransferase
MQPSEFPRANVLGVGVSAINMEHALSLFESWLSNGVRGYVCVTGVHGVMEAQKDPHFRRILNESLLTTPDGMPTVWVGKLQGFYGMDRVFGPDLMAQFCKFSCSRGYTHFLYGGGLGTATRLKDVLTARFPGLRVVGTYTPPFRPLTTEEERALLQQVSSVKPDIFWIGLSTPKQERFMAEYLHKIEAKIMVGVGAAFDYHTGAIRDSSDWVKKAGLQWLHRLLQDPARLSKRYLINNPKFLLKTALQFGGFTKYLLPDIQHTDHFPPKTESPN